MKSASVSLAGALVGVVLVEPWQLAEPHASATIRQLQARVPDLPIMLVARDEAAPAGVRAYAKFVCQRHLAQLLATPNIEWGDLPEPGARGPAPF